jgi:3-oxoacyl-[acyl-carrier-protein] synthase III
MFRAMKSAAADTYEGCGRQPEEFRWLVLGDYNRLTRATYSRLLGFKPEATFLDNVGRMGHIPFDSLINLADLRTGGQVASGDSLLLFLCGPISCGSVALKAI